MIVKNEAADIGRCLNSVKDVVDYYLIADTGSTDGTPEIIKELLKGVEGEVLFHDWVNFGHNREKILQCAYQNKNIDYCLIIDADEELIGDKSAFKKLTADCYAIERRQATISYHLPSLINIKRQEWHWKGVVHNYLSGLGSREILEGVTILHHYGKGGKSSGLSQREKFLRDAALLEEEIRKNPSDTRSVFYLAQSYRDAGEPQKAYENYIKRVELGGWAEEVYYSMLQAGSCKEDISGNFPLEDFLEAYNYRPTRVEAVHDIVRYFRSKKQYYLAYLFAKEGNKIPPSKDVLFVRRDMEEWRMKDELAISAYWIGKYKESEELCDELLRGKLPEREVERVKKNRDYARRELAKQ